MTIANTKASNVFNANGVTRDFNLGFVYDENVSGISIKVIDTEGTETEVSSNYTIYNGVLTYPTVDSGLDPLAEGYKITIERLTPHTQTIDLIQQGPLDAETLEGGYDKLTMEVQELQDASDRSIKFPVQVEGETDAQQYIDDLTDLKNTATSAAATATEQAGLASAAKTAAETAQDKAEKWAEGTDQEVAALGGTHSAEGWAGIAQAAAESEAVQTVAENIEDVNTVAGIQSDVTQVASISTAVTNVSDHDTEVNTVYDNLSSVITTATNINDVNAVAGIKNDVVAVSNIKANVTSVAGNISNINAVAANATNINAVNSNKTNIDTVAGSSTNINTVATNISDVTSVATSIADVAAVADDLTDISAVADDLTNIDTVATNISDVSATGQHIDNVNAVAGSLAGINLVANDLTNIDIVASGVAEWQKPEDWVDIRSGALPNSIYFLAAHKKDYSAYTSFGVTVNVNNGGTYDVYVDGVKYATNASGTFFVINWQTLNLDSGYDVTYPQELRTHIVRVTPSDQTKTINGLAFGGYNSTSENKKSTLWVHCNLSYAINCNQFVGNTSGRMTDSLLEAVTSRDGVLKCNSAGQMIGGQYNLKTLPILDFGGTSGGLAYFAYNSYAPNLNKIHIRNLHQTGTVGNSEAFSYTRVKEIIFEDSTVCWWHNLFGTYCENLVRIPEGLYHPTDEIGFYMRNGFEYLEDTVLDLTPRTGLTQLQIEGSAGKRVDGLKGVTVSSSAPFTGGSPQISLKYTGLDRAALITLFNSLPTVTNNQVCNITGATGAADLTAADLAIATNKGWTVTR